MVGIRWPFVRFAFVIYELAVKALLALAGVHAYLASCVERLFGYVSGIHTALLLAFLGPVTIIAVAAFWAYHILIATAARVFLFQFGTAFLTLVRRYRAAALHIDTCLRESRRACYVHVPSSGDDIHPDITNIPVLTFEY
jgi:hypothetical protein